MNKITHITIINSSAVQLTLSNGSHTVLKVGDFAPAVALEVSIAHAIIDKVVERAKKVVKKASVVKKVAKRA